MKNEVVQRPLNLKQAAEFLGLTESYVYNLIHFGKLTAYKPGGKKLLFKVSDLERYAFGGNVVGGHADRADMILSGAKKKPRLKAMA